jgi:hypothetical protein
MIIEQDSPRIKGFKFKDKKAKGQDDAEMVSESIINTKVIEKEDKT